MQLKLICKISNKICKKYHHDSHDARYASNMQVLMISPYIACNMQNMQKSMHDMQYMQTSISICRICAAHFADHCGWARGLARDSDGSLSDA